MDPYIPGTTMFNNGQLVQFCAICITLEVPEPKQSVTIEQGTSKCIDHVRVNDTVDKNMPDKDVNELVAIVRNSLAHLPKTDSAVHQMIAQGIRSAYIRGRNHQPLITDF